MTGHEQGHAVRCRGTVIGILKAFLGLSGSFFTTVYVSFLDPDAVSFLMMLAVVPSAIVLTCLCFVNYVPYIQVEPHTKVAGPRNTPPLQQLYASSNSRSNTTLYSVFINYQFSLLCSICPKCM